MARAICVIFPGDFTVLLPSCFASEKFLDWRRKTGVSCESGLFSTPHGFFNPLHLAGQMSILRAPLSQVVVSGTELTAKKEKTDQVQVLEETQ